MFDTAIGSMLKKFQGSIMKKNIEGTLAFDEVLKKAIDVNVWQESFAELLGQKIYSFLMLKLLKKLIWVGEKF